MRTLAGHRLKNDDGVDDRTVRFLLKQSLALNREKEEERRRRALESIELVFSFLVLLMLYSLRLYGPERQDSSCARRRLWQWHM